MDKLISKAYQLWKHQDDNSGRYEHPSDEVFAAFIDKKLKLKEKKSFMQHVISCPLCKNKILLASKIPGKSIVPSKDVLNRVKNYIQKSLKEFADIVVNFHNGMFGVLESNIDCFCGHSEVKSLVLRNKQKVFKDYIVFFKKTNKFILEVKITKESQDDFSVYIEVKNLFKKIKILNFRASLVCKQEEVQSFGLVKNKAIFDNLKFNAYKIIIYNRSDEIIGVKFVIK